MEHRHTVGTPETIGFDEAMKVFESLVGFKLSGVSVVNDGGVHYLDFEFEENFRVSIPVSACDKMRFLTRVSASEDSPKTETTIQ